VPSLEILLSAVLVLSCGEYMVMRFNGRRELCTSIDASVVININNSSPIVQNKTNRAECNS